MRRSNRDEMAWGRNDRKAMRKRGSGMGGAQLARTFLESTKFSKYTKFITKWTELLVQNFG